jgi:hypothetical protein
MHYSQGCLFTLITFFEQQECVCNYLYAVMPITVIGGEKHGCCFVHNAATKDCEKIGEKIDKL